MIVCDHHPTVFHFRFHHSMDLFAHSMIHLPNRPLYDDLRFRLNSIRLDEANQNRETLPSHKNERMDTASKGQRLILFRSYLVILLRFGG